jgi:hypothetical protein
MVYIAIGVAAAVTARALADVGHGATFDLKAEGLMDFIGMPLLSVFAGIRSYVSLVKRCTQKHLADPIWTSAPTNPQSNRLAQIIGFGCLGLSAASQRADGSLRMFGFFAIWISVALGVSLIVFRARHVCRRSGGQS